MDLAHSGLEGGTDPIYYPVRRPDEQPLTQTPFTQNSGHAPDVSLESIFTHQLDALRNGARVSGSYFDVRFYQGAGTVHFFPNKKKNMVDRLNRFVGKHRAWIPPRDEDVTKNFWEAFDKAEKMEKEIVQAANLKRSTFSTVFGDLIYNREQGTKSMAEEAIVTAIEQVLEANDISPHFQALEDKTPAQPQLLLLAA